MRLSNRDVSITHPEKVLFPLTSETKKDLIDYYLTVANVMVPHLKRRGVSLERYPDGLDGEGFFQKDAPRSFPDWIKTETIPKREGGSFHAPVVDSEAALVYLVNKAAITFHLYLSRVDDLERPDRMIYDLDPPEGSGDSQAVREAALDLRGLMDELDLQTWIQTTGSKGFHVVVPTDRRSTFDEVRNFARDAARILVLRKSDRYTLEQRKEKRGERVYIDTIRNAYGATAVAPYAVRALPNGPVAAPVTWKEVEEGVSPREWTMATMPERAGRGEDPWSDLARYGRSLSKRGKELAKLLERETNP